MDSSTSIATERFQKLLDGLPPELHGMICDCTFSAGPTTHHITKDYKPPNALQVSRATRNRFAKSHYELATFKTSSQATLRRWLLTLKPEHVKQINTVHFELTQSPHSASKPQQAREAAKHQGPKQAPKTRPSPKDTKAPGKQQPPFDAKTAKNTQPPKQARLNGKPSRMRRNNDMNYAGYKIASARLFYTESFLKKRKIRLKKGVLKTNVKFEGMDEEILTDNPEVAFKEWKKARMRN